MMNICDQLTLFGAEEQSPETPTAPSWPGAPLAYTTAYHAPDDLDAAFTCYQGEHGIWGSARRSHMWHREFINPFPWLVEGHEIHLFTAQAWCDVPDHTGCADLPGHRLHQANCPLCRWHHIGEETEVVEAWHDHALPGWRALPVLPGDLARFQAAPRVILAWMQRTYPPSWLRPGVPILTERHPRGTRALAGRSPLGGYDLCIAVSAPLPLSSG